MRFRIAMTLLEATKVMLAAGLALSATEPPLYRLPAAVAFGAALLIAFLGVVSAQMPSWGASAHVARAATAAELPPRG